MTKRRHAAGNGVSQTVRMIDITYAAAAAATAVANLSSLSYRNFIVLTFFMDFNSIVVAVGVLQERGHGSKLAPSGFSNSSNNC